jgi:hypothetical protein
VFALGGTKIATFVYDRTVLKDGSIISVSNYNGSELFSLAERLKLPESFKVTVPRSVVEEGNTYSIRSALRIFGSLRKSLITNRVQDESNVSHSKRYTHSADREEVLSGGRFASYSESKLNT